MARTEIIDHEYTSKTFDRGFPLSHPAHDGPAHEHDEPAHGHDGPEAPKEKLEENITKWPILRIVALCISVMSSILSAFFSFEFLGTVLPDAIAWPLACVVVSCSVLAPEYVILLWRKKRIVLSLIVAMTGITSSGFSVISTVAGQYNARAGSARDAAMAARAVETESRIKADITRTDRDIDAMQKRIELAAQEGKADVNAAYIKARDEKEKARLLLALEKTQENITGERNDFYTWVANIMSATPDGVEFSLSLFPAVLLDVAAPVFAIVVMVLQ